MYEQANADGSSSYFVEGDLGMGDVDFFKFPVGASLVSATCSGTALGSGATIKASVVTMGGGLVDPMATADETLMNGASFQDAPSGFPGNANLWLKVEKTAQSGMVASNYYRCGVRVYDPAP